MDHNKKRKNSFLLTFLKLNKINNTIAIKIIGVLMDKIGMDIPITINIKTSKFNLFINRIKTIYKFLM